MALPFDRVTLTTPEGVRHLTVREFCELPLSQRLRMVLERRVEFSLGEQAVDSTAALRALRELG